MAGIPEGLKGRSYTRVSDWTRDELQTALDLADELKVERVRRRELRALPGRTVALIFRKPSTRTRISARFGAHFIVACPPGYEPRAETVASAKADAAASGGSVEIVTDPREAAADANVLYTDVWVSMGQDDGREQRLRDFEPYRL